MSEWKPRVKAGLRWDSLSLSTEDGFLLSRIDGVTNVQGLEHLTGLSSTQVQAALARLHGFGALEPPPAATPSAAPPVPSSATRSTLTHGRRPVAPAPAAPPPRAPAPMPLDDDDGDDDDDLFTDDAAALERRPDDDHDDHDDAEALRAALEELSEDDDIVSSAPTAGAHAPPAAARAAPADRLDDGADAADRESAEADDDTHSEDDSEDEADEAGNDEEAAGEGDDVEEGNHRKLFETTLRDLPQEEREKLAKTSSGATLLALCFDPVPQVVGGIFENPAVGFPHARLVARHHRTGQGLDDVCRRSEFARDAQVQRFLMANPMLSDALLKKLLAPKRLDAVYKWALSRDLPERNRTKVRLALRSKWSTAEGEERAHLIFTTEGRVLNMLIGLPFDSQTTTLLCARSMNSLMLIQNLARFSATPPQVLQHLLKQALVKRQPHLRTLIAQHPNCPSDVKRKLRET